MTRSQTDFFRRRLLAFTGSFFAWPYLTWAGALQPTPRQTSGPFYPEALPLDDDNDLTRVAGQGTIAAGRITDLIGRVLDTNGNPLAGTRVEIWQCDANGRYHHPRDRGPGTPDENFQGHGRATTDNDGNYRFRTIRPVPYPGRTPHIHAAVFPSGGINLVTQIYVEGEPRNGGDFIFRGIPEAQRPLVLAAFLPAERPGVEFEARIDLVIGATPDQG